MTLEANQADYGRPIRPIDIIVTEQASNPGSPALRNTAALIAGRK